MCDEARVVRGRTGKEELYHDGKRGPEEKSGFAASVRT
jgi:hypothetical protein